MGQMNLEMFKDPQSANCRNRRARLRREGVTGSCKTRSATAQLSFVENFLLLRTSRKCQKTLLLPPTVKKVLASEPSTQQHHPTQPPARILHTYSTLICMAEDQASSMNTISSTKRHLGIIALADRMLLSVIRNRRANQETSSLYRVHRSTQLIMQRNVTPPRCHTLKRLKGILSTLTPGIPRSLAEE
ncbi:uncharacterized protein K444DRAFT_407897 [Hyaloscypha bicolor E]|uniref:Uncharacterized protein n=1 Tax=Hyaloscypha bicolor E TaxID=1095630 RepID=A0A2J6T9M6_9HELO|nr:uncharacterized protein K444DRAFT_407897 [Hyaloscypha bicolor E]PMD59683.1 hypothetical protein K444DRAFT_407897 [Hyaloscypha bicolor E]